MRTRRNGSLRPWLEFLFWVVVFGLAAAAMLHGAADPGGSATM